MALPALNMHCSRGLLSAYQHCLFALARNFGIDSPSFSRQGALAYHLLSQRAPSHPTPPLIRGIIAKNGPKEQTTDENLRSLDIMVFRDCQGDAKGHTEAYR